MLFVQASDLGNLEVPGQTRCFLKTKSTFSKLLEQNSTFSETRRSQAEHCRTTPQRGGLLWAYKAEGGRQRLKALPLTSFKPLPPLSLAGRTKRPSYYRAAPKGAPLLPLERVLVLLDAQLVQRDVVGLLPLMYFAIVASFRPTVDT